MKILLHKGTGWISRAIKWQSRGPYSHASVEIGGKFYEAREFKGTRVLSHPSSDAFEVFEVAGLLDTQEKAAEQFLIRQIGKPYDYTMVLRFITRQNESRKSSGKWFCSELVAAMMKHIDMQLFANTEPWEVPPNWIHRSIRLRPSTL